MKGSGTLAWKRCPLPFPSLLPSTDTHSHTYTHPTHTAFNHWAHQKLVISLIHSDSLETQCRLTSVLYTPYIRKMKRPCKHRQRTREKKKERKGKRTKLLQLFSLLYSHKKNKIRSNEWNDMYRLFWCLLYPGYAALKWTELKSNERRSRTWKSTTSPNWATSMRLSLHLFPLQYSCSSFQPPLSHQRLKPKVPHSFIEIENLKCLCSFCVLTHKHKVQTNTQSMHSQTYADTNCHKLWG